MKKEKKLRKAHQDGYARRMASSGGSVSKPFLSVGLQHLNTPSPGDTIISGTPGAGCDQRSPGINTESLARWVSAVKPGSVPQGLQSQTPRIHGERINSMASVGMVSEAGPGWNNHGRLDSCAASAWGSVHISDVESSAHDNDEDDDLFVEAKQHRLYERSRSGGTSASLDEWNVPGNMYGSGHSSSIGNLGRTGDLGTTASSTFFNDLEGPSHRANDSIMIALGNRQYGGDDDDDSSDYGRSPGIMTETGSVWPTPRSQAHHDSRWPPDMTTGRDGEAMARWDGSSAPSPTGGTTQTLVPCIIRHSILPERLADICFEGWGGGGCMPPIVFGCRPNRSIKVAIIVAIIVATAQR